MNNTDSIYKVKLFHEFVNNQVVPMNVEMMEHTWNKKKIIFIQRKQYFCRKTSTPKKR